jgi:hypothetical protein
VNLLEIRQRLLDNVDDPDQQLWTNEHLHRLLNAAYQDVVLAAHNADPEILVHTAETTVSAGFQATLPDDAELNPRLGYELYLPVDFHKLVQVMCQNVLQWVEFQIISLTRAWHYFEVTGGDWGPDGYAYVRRSSVGKWILGLMGSGSSNEVRIWYLPVPPQIIESTSGTYEPELPVEFHELIVLRGTVLLLAAENRDNTMFMTLYDQGIGSMQLSLSQRRGQVVGV